MHGERNIFGKTRTSFVQRSTTKSLQSTGCRSPTPVAAQSAGCREPWGWRSACGLSVPWPHISRYFGASSSELDSLPLTSLGNPRLRGKDQLCRFAAFRGRGVGAAADTDYDDGSGAACPLSLLI